MGRSERHREVAASVADELATRAHVEAVLLVGSTATGHADEYSDVDLEVVGGSEAGQRSVDGIHVEWTPVERADLETTLAGWTDDAALYSYAHADLLSDQTGVGDLLAAYDDYPPAVRREKLFAGWYYGSGEAFDARKAERRGDERAKQCAAVSAVEQFVALGYVLAGAFPPYRTWLFRDPPTELPGVDAALGGDVEALDAMARAVESELGDYLSDERIDEPYLHEPRYDRLG